MPSSLEPYDIITEAVTSRMFVSCLADKPPQRKERFMEETIDYF